MASESPRTAAVFAFEFLDTGVASPDGQVSAAERQRLDRLTQQLRQDLAATGKFRIVSTDSVAQEAKKINLFACEGCELQLARTLGSDVVVTGFVHKVSNLILGIRVQVKDTQSGKLLAGGSVDIRGNTDESWSRGLKYLMRNRLIPQVAQ